MIVLAWYLALFSPQARDLSKAHKAHAAAEQKVSQLQGQVVQLDALKSQIPGRQGRPFGPQCRRPGVPAAR